VGAGRTQGQLAQPSCTFVEMVSALVQQVVGRWEDCVELDSAYDQHQKSKSDNPRF